MGYADFSAKRRFLEIVCLNLRLDGVTLCATIRKPFDIVAEGLISAKSRGDSHCTLVNETTGLWLVRGLFPQVLHFEGDAVLRLVQKGLYSKRR